MNKSSPASIIPQCISYRCKACRGSNGWSCHRLRSCYSNASTSISVCGANWPRPLSIHTSHTNGCLVLWIYHGGKGVWADHLLKINLQIWGCKEVLAYRMSLYGPLRCILPCYCDNSLRQGPDGQMRFIEMTSSRPSAICVFTCSPLFCRRVQSVKESPQL